MDTIEHEPQENDVIEMLDYFDNLREIMDEENETFIQDLGLIA